MPPPFHLCEIYHFPTLTTFLHVFKIHTTFLRIPPFFPCFLTPTFLPLSPPSPVSSLRLFTLISSLPRFLHSDFFTLISSLPRFLHSDFFTFPSPPDFSLSAAVISTSPPFPFTLVLHSLSLSFFLTFSFYTSTPISSGFLTFSRFNFSCSLLFYNRNFLILFLPSISSPSLPPFPHPDSLMLSLHFHFSHLLPFPHFNFPILFLPSISSPSLPPFPHPLFSCHFFFSFSCFCCFLSCVFPFSSTPISPHPLSFPSPQHFCSFPMLASSHPPSFFYVFKTGEEI